MKTYVNLTRFQILLYYFASFFYFAPVSVKNNIIRPVGFLRKSYAVILTILISFWTYFVFFKRQTQRLEITFAHQAVSAMSPIILAGTLSVTVIIFAFNSNEMVEIFNRIAAIKNELKKLGIEDYCRKNRNKFYAKIIATSCIVLSARIMIVYVIGHRRHDDYTFLVIFYIGSIVLTMQSHGTILIFVETIICIRRLFQSLNKKLQDAQQDSSVFRTNGNRRISDQLTHRITTDSEFENMRLSVKDVKTIGKLHGEICDLLESTTRFYTIPILFNIVRHFINLLSISYSSYTYAFIQHKVLDNTQFISPFSQRLIARAITSLLELLLIAHACTSVSQMGNATKAITHEIWNTFHPEVLRDELFKFSLQLLHKPIIASAFGFFDLGYSFLFKIFYALVAYLVAMIQFKESQPNIIH